MPRLRSNGLELEYDTFGAPTDPAMVLIMGHGAQLIDWHVEFCERLAGHGFHVVRFDNRDAGLSTSMDHEGAPDLALLLTGDARTAPYVLADMAEDTVGLMDGLGLDRAHLVGASMGGMIAQQTAIDHPERLYSLCSIMSTTGDPAVGHATPEAMAALTRPPASTRDEAIRNGIESSKAIGSPAFPIPDEELTQRVAAKYDRSLRPTGQLRQFAAILASPNRTTALAAVTVPTVVIHGAEDPLIDVSGGRATAAAVPGAELVVVPGLGHNLPREVWPTITDAIVRNATRADRVTRQ